MKDAEGVEKAFQWFWQVNDMFDYDNIGFCRAAEGSTFKVPCCLGMFWHLPVCCSLS